MDKARQHLQHTFQLATFRPGQERVISTLLQGQSALAVFPTGGGKSLCYQLTALLLDGLTLVVSPLIALMKDQVDALNALNIPAARLDSSVSSDEATLIYDGLATGTLKILYVAPERLANERFVARLKKIKIDLMAIDEAHCVSEWGHNFRPDYLKLAQVARTLNVGRVLALTATATPAVANQICQNFVIAPENHIQTGFYRENLQLHIRPSATHSRDSLLLEQLGARPSEPAIVYVTRQKTAQQVATFLSGHGLKAMAYHAGLKDDERDRVQNAFMGGGIDIVVATIAFGMGIDKSNIRAIYHYNLPKSLENYMQETGRAGRDGAPAYCHLFACLDDLTVLENFTYGDTPDRSALAGLLQWLLQQQDTFDLSVYELSQQFDVRPLVIGTLLTYLELAGVISATSPFYTEYKVGFSVPMENLLGTFDQDRRVFLERLFACGRSGRTWLTLKPADAATALNEPQQRIVRALNYLEQKDMVQLKVAGVRQGYRVQQRPDNSGELIEQINQQFRNREARDIERLQQVYQWAESNGCLQQSLVAYFGEELAAACGHCSSCVGEPVQIQARQTKPVDTQIISAVVQECHAALAQARPLARFLCGITSPKASKARLARHASFGALDETPFNEVLQACNEILQSATKMPRAGQ